MHLLFEFARVKILIDLQVLESVKVEVAQDASTLHLLKVELALIGHRRETKEATYAIRLGPAVPRTVILEKTISVVDHIETFLDVDVVEVAGQDESIRLHRLVQLEEEV